MTLKAVGYQPMITHTCTDMHAHTNTLTWIHSHTHAHTQHR